MKKILLIILSVIILALVVAGAVYFLKPAVIENVEEPQEEAIIEGKIINIKNYNYEPLVLTINIGETVTWINQDSVKHTVTSDTGSELNSNLLGKGESYSHKFETSGSYEYHCIPHPSMKGTVVVV